MVTLQFTYKGEIDSITVEPNESDVYKAIGEKIGSLAKEIPGILSVDAGIYGYAEYDMISRGSFIKDGTKYPSLYVTEKHNSITGLDAGIYEPAYLTCINPESNNYKFYHLKPRTYGIDATYGRIGTERGEAFGTRDLQQPYPRHMFWIRYYEKLSKGYTDQTDIYLSKPKQPSTKKKASKGHEATGPSAELYNMLMRYAKHVVKKTLVDERITQAQVEEARRIYTELCKKVQLKAFNRWLMKLLVLSPRRIDGRSEKVSDFLAKSPDDFADIIYREEALLVAMETVAGGHQESAEADLENSFAKYDIEVYEATAEQKEKVVSKLSDQLKPLVKKVYRVIPRSQKKKFDKYLKDRHIRHVKELWHGSRNENWLSIITNSLQLNPNAQITGKMFGQGIYFAPSSMKSWGYTSFQGTHWARGSSNTAFMGVYAVAYGKPFSPDRSTVGSWIDEKFVRSKGGDCLHAEALKTGLRNDEIVFYNESAVCLNYIVEFSA